VTCWGRNLRGQTTVPDGLVNPTAVATGQSQSCALDDNGVTCWGGSKDWHEADVPTGLLNPTTITTGMLFSCTLDDNGVICWGHEDGAAVPDDLSNPTAVAAGGTSSEVCAIDDSGVVCWGANWGGGADAPDTLVNPRVVTTGGGHSCALDDNGMTCWGYDNYGQATVARDLLLVPEPSRSALLASALGTLMFLVWRHRSRYAL